MKLLISLLLILSSVFAYAGPGDGPIVPWPTVVDRRPIYTEELAGEWVAYGHNSIWFISIEQNGLGDDISSIKIASAALFNRRAMGWFTSAERLFYGEIKMDDTHATAFVIFKDHEGTKLRIATGRGRFLDLKLYRDK